MLALCAVAGCGFAPVYGDGSAMRGTISFSTPDSIAGFRMHERLVERLGAPTAPRYGLRISIAPRLTPATITRDGDITRFNLIGAANWTFTDAQGTKLDSGRVETFASYSATGSTVATQAAQTDAEARLSVALADLIVSRLLALPTDLTQ